MAKVALSAVSAIMLLFGFGAIVLGTGIMLGAKSAVHEIEAGILFLIAAVCALTAVTGLSAASILHALEMRGGAGAPTSVQAPGGHWG